MLYVVGLGPGGKGDLSGKAIETLQKAEVIVGYTTYIRLIREFIEDKEVITTGMKKEIERCHQAIAVAEQGKDVAVVSSGDAGVYGMAGLIYELLSKSKKAIDVEVIPGITASIGGAALLGAPLMNDFCHISLSDLMTPWEVIEKRLHAAASGDFVICLYNPRSKGRPKHLANALAIVGQYKEAGTLVGLAKDVGRKKEAAHVTTLADLDETLVDMTTVLIIGNKETFTYKGKMITPRGYQV
ncbi:precorrin-3B C(17)-methyltransferase [Enterococcus casseliflavus]|uniref:precorrin-3B C(17)-methyltransferase n=1 Tax=Enterococcus casseliflavus TaxID=37734 RepID=UPI0022E42F29|nr:precorrin-3B C(17)-methyltransferase [Enterococcus casseliflavus]MEB6086011.1 precorrin-3B C(17)-methyltransferase [Enterococcus casseliflavus]